MRIRLLALAALACPLTAHAAEPALLDPRLSDAETFGHYADLSKPRPAAVNSPAWRPEGETTARREALSLARPASIPLAAPRPVPQAPILLAPPRAEAGRPGIPPLGWIALGAGAAGLGILLALSAATARPRKERSRRPPAPARAAELDEPLAPILRWKPPPAIFTLPPAPTALEAAEPASPHAEPRWAASWKAVTAEEQRAIDAWDRSVEKRLGLASLEEWLDLHGASLGTLDVPRLKAKLHRDA